MKKCPVCGYENDDGRKFCRECGEVLEIIRTKSAKKGFDSIDDNDDFFGSGSFDDDETVKRAGSRTFDDNLTVTDQTDKSDDAEDITEHTEESEDVEDITEQADESENVEDITEHTDETDDTASDDDDDDVRIYKFPSERDDTAQKPLHTETDDSELPDDTDVFTSADKKADDDKGGASGDETERYVSTTVHDKRRKKKKPEREGSVAGDIIFIFSTILLTVMVVVLCILYIKQNFPGETLSENVHYILTSTFTDGMITKDPTIEPDETAEGEPAIRITVYARRGCVVCFREGATVMERTMEGQSIAFRVPTSLWTSMHKGEDSASIEIVPNVFVYDPERSNDVVQLEFKPYNAALQTVDITLISPSTDVFTTSGTSVPIEGRVSDNSVAVFMNGNQLQLAEDGYFRTVYHITGDKSSEHRVVFTAQKSGYAIGSKVLIIKYNKSDIKLEIYNDSLRTFEDRIEIKGKAEKGVDISVSGVETENGIDIKKSGEFSFVALVPGVGNYAVTLTLKDKNGESSTVIYLEHAPDKDAYVSSTSSFDYEWLCEHPTMDKHFGITGTVVEIYQNEPYVRARLHTSQGDIIFTYYHTTEVATDDNKSYRLYCFPDGTDGETGLPQVYCWFIFKS